MAQGSIPLELGTERIGVLLRKYAIPGIIAMTASSLYNMVDSMFIGRMPGTGSLALSGLAISLPLMNISTALGTLVGVGASTMISILLGQKRYDSANRVLSNAVSLNIIVGLVFTAVTLLWMDPILRAFGATENTLPFAREYMIVLSLGNIVTHLYFGLNSIIRASGNPRIAMTLTLFTVISNAILDPLFIYTFHLGIQGAAIATVLCQTLALIYTLIYFFKPDRFLRLEFRGLLRVDWKIAWDSLKIGMAPFLMHIASCVVAIFVNNQLLKYGGDLAIGAYGINNRLTFLFIMVCLGLNQGMQPIAGYNFGARLYSRVRKVYLRTAFWATLVCAVGCIVALFLPGLAVRIFTNDPPMIELAERGLRLMNCIFIVVGFQMVAGNLFQCLGMVRKSILMSLSRQLLFLVPCLYLLPLWLGQDGVWISFPISDALAAALALFLILRLFHKFSLLKDGDDPAILGSTL
ncbi:MAG: MATE family efflux transporter [Bacteroidales bacterium]|nr:MATE family efflux transporter [Bacteroidales bacterium]